MPKAEMEIKAYNPYSHLSDEELLRAKKEVEAKIMESIKQEAIDVEGKSEAVDISPRVSK